MIDWQVFKNRKDSEHRQAGARIGLMALVFAYCGIYNLAYPQAVDDSGLLVVGCHLVFSVILLAHIYLYPEVCPGRRVFSIFFDVILGTTALFILGQVSAILLFLYFSLSISYGLRYGQAYLYTAVGASVASLTVLFSFSEFWGQYPALAFGLILALIIVSVQLSASVDKLSLSKRKPQPRTNVVDEVTGLPNRNSLFQFLNGTIDDANKNGSSFSVLFVDIDGFKKINERYGESVGDELLKAIAGRIKHQIRKDDTFYRIGGDEFVGILRNIEDDGAKRVAESIVQSIQRPFHIENTTLTASVSIGIATFPVDGHSSDTLLSRSDMAMYHAKRSGKNTVHIYSRAS